MSKNSGFIPQWPRERDLSHYGQLTGIDFHKTLNSRSVWIDIGCRSGMALTQSRKFCRARLVGINVHPMRVKRGIEHVFASIPEDPYVLNIYQRTAHVLTDVYGAFAYCSNPLETLLYEAQLLRPGGQAVIYGLEARFGTQETWNHTTSFFSKYMKQEIKFLRTRGQTGSGRPLKTLRITITGHCQMHTSREELRLLVQRLIGLPKKVRMIFQPPDHSAVQWHVIYRK